MLGSTHRRDLALRDPVSTLPSSSVSPSTPDAILETIDSLSAESTAILATPLCVCVVGVGTKEEDEALVCV